MSETNSMVEEFEVLLHKLIVAAQHGNKKALDDLNMVKEWLKDN